MSKVPKNYYQALATMVGYVVGVGMFGLPFLVSKAGILCFVLLLLVLGVVQYLIHLIYANIIVATDSFHRLPGYTEIYLGKAGKNFVFMAKIFSNFGALLAYIIITGIFLHQLLSPHLGGSEFFYSTLIFIIEAVIVFFGIKIIAKAEVVMIIFLLLVIGLITWRGLGVIDATNYVIMDWRLFLLPYGAMLFSLDGGGSLPIVAKLLKKDKDSMKSVVRFGTLIPIMVILTFVLVVVGISGEKTTPDALTGVRLVLDDGVVFFSLIFGILTMVTSFFGVAESVRETLWWDFKVNKILAWAIAVFVPYILYLLGFKDLIEVIGFVGAIGGGLCGIVLILIYRKMSKMKNMTPMFNRFYPGKILTSLIIALFISGIFYEVYYYFHDYINNFGDILINIF